MAAVYYITAVQRPPIHPTRREDLQIYTLIEKCTYQEIIPIRLSWLCMEARLKSAHHIVDRPRSRRDSDL
jgi:hypothetical protein